IALAGVQRAADLRQELLTQASRQGGTIDDGDGLAQGEISVGVLGRVGGAVDGQYCRGHTVFQNFQGESITPPLDATDVPGGRKTSAPRESKHDTPHWVTAPLR